MLNLPALPNIAERVLEALDRTRGFGNTTCVVRGAREHGGMIVVMTHHEADNVAVQFGKGYVPYCTAIDLPTRQLGHQKPLVFDNTVVRALALEAVQYRANLQQAMNEVDRLSSELRKSELMIDMVRSQLNV